MRWTARPFRHPLFARPDTDPLLQHLCSQSIKYTLGLVLFNSLVGLLLTLGALWAPLFLAAFFSFAMVSQGNIGVAGPATDCAVPMYRRPSRGCPLPSCSKSTTPTRPAAAAARSRRSSSASPTSATRTSRSRVSAGSSVSPRRTDSRPRQCAALCAPRLPSALVSSVSGILYMVLCASCVLSVLPKYKHFTILGE